MRDTKKGVEITQTKSYANICNSCSSNSRAEEQIFGNKSIVNYPCPSDNISLINYKKYNNIKDNIGVSKVDSASTLFYDLDTAAKRRPLNCTSELSLARREQASLKYTRYRIKPKLKQYKKYYPVREYSKKSIIDSEIDLNESKKNFEIFSNHRQTYILNTDPYLKPHQHNKVKRVNDEKLCYITKYPKEISSPFIPSRRKKYTRNSQILQSNTHKLSRYPQSSTKLKTELNKNKKHSYTLIKRSDISLRSPNKEKSINNPILSYSTPKHKNPHHNHSLDEPILNLAQSSNHNCPNNSKYFMRNKNIRVRKRRIQCPNCQEKVQLAITTDDDRKCKYTYSNNIIEKSQTMDYKYLPNNYKSDFHRRSYRHSPQCHIPSSEMTYSDQIYEKNNPATANVIKACRHDAPYVMVQPCQKSESLRNHYKYLVDCSQSPICVSLPLCIPCKTSVNLNEMSTKHNNKANNLEFQGKHRKFFPLCEQDINVNAMYPNNLEESHKSQDPFAHNSLIQTNLNQTSFHTCKPDQANCNYYKMDRSCQYVCFDPVTNMQIRTVNAKSEGVIYIRDVGCQFHAKPNKNKNNVDLPQEFKQSSVIIIEKDSTQSNHVTNSKRLRYEINTTNHQSEEEIESTDEDSIGGSSRSASSTHNSQINSTGNRACGFVPAGNTSQFIAYTRTEPVLNNHTSRSTIKGEVPYSETFSNVSPTRVISRRSFLKQKYKRIFCARRRRRMVDSSFGKMNKYKTVIS